jgi:hypothetical protein
LVAVASALLNSGFGAAAGSFVDAMKKSPVYLEFAIV